MIASGSPDGPVLTFDKNISRHPAGVVVTESPGISANVEIWGIKTGVMSLYCLPEGILSYTDGYYRALAYEALGVTYQPSRTAEGGEVPEDAEIVGETWRYEKADGAPPSATLKTSGTISSCTASSR